MFKNRILCAALASLLVSPLVIAGSQSSSATQKEKDKEKEKAKPKAKRVWTEDEVKDLRRPVDEYVEQKAVAEEAAARAAADKAAAEAAAKANPGSAAAATAAKEPEPPDNLPKTLEEAEERVLTKEADVRLKEERLNALREQLAGSTSQTDKDNLQKRVEEEAVVVSDAMVELDVLKNRRDELKKKEAEKTEQKPAPAPAKPPQQ